MAYPHMINHKICVAYYLLEHHKAKEVAGLGGARVVVQVPVPVKRHLREGVRKCEFS